MALTLRNDEQIKVGTTPGLVAGSSFFIFDGSAGKKDYRYYELVVSELNGRGILAKDLDYSWSPLTGRFDLLQSGDLFALNTIYNIHFQQVQQSVVLNPSALINRSFFVRDINIPNTEPYASGVNPILEELNSFISRYEPQCLQRVLGYKMYKALVEETSQRITDLIYGAEYTDEYGELRKWQGLVHDEDVSLIANYIYYFYQETKAKNTTGKSTAVMKTEQGESSTPQDKMVSAWKFLSEEVTSLSSFLWNSKNLDGSKKYPEYTHFQDCVTKRDFRKTNVFGF